MVTTSAPVDRSTLRLSEVARHVVIPEGIVDTLWFEVEARCREFGDTFDAWQDGLGQVTLGIRADGTFAATVGGVTYSIPRQVAKTFIVGRIVVALCTLYPGLTVLWTAHRTRTATNTFQKLKGYVTRRAVKPYLEPGRNMGTAIRDANGEQEIPFANGSRIMFGAREQGFGRGFDEVDIEVFDEAQILTEKALEDMVAATNQSRFAHGALLFYMGTPPRPVDPGEAFTGRRAEALELKGDRPDFSEPVAAGDALYVECSADPTVGAEGGPDLDDPRQVEQANPSYPHRTPPVAVQRLRKNLPSDEGWKREGLGVWDAAEKRETAVDLTLWRRRIVKPEHVSPDWPLAAVGLDMDPSGRVWVAVAAHSEEPGVHGELLPDDPLAEGSDVAVQWLWERCRKRLPVVMPADSGATVLEAALLAKGMKVYKLNPPEQALASLGLVQALKDGDVTHLNDPALEQSVREAPKAFLRDGRERIGRGGELASAPLLAFAAARFGAVKWSKRRRALTETDNNERRAVIL